MLFIVYCSESQRHHDCVSSPGHRFNDSSTVIGSQVTFFQTDFLLLLLEAEPDMMWVSPGPGLDRDTETEQLLDVHGRVHYDQMSRPHSQGRVNFSRNVSVYDTHVQHVSATFRTNSPVILIQRAGFRFTGCVRCFL